MRLRLAGVKPNSDAMRIMISAWRLATATYGDCIGKHPQAMREEAVASDGLRAGA